MSSDQDSSAEGPARVRWGIPGVFVQRSERLITRRDVIVVVGLGAGYLLSFVVPKRLDPWLAQLLARAFMALRRKNVARVEEVMRGALGDRAASLDLRSAAREFYLVRGESLVARMRGMRPRAWDAPLVVEGREYVDAALAAGRGAILWRMDMGDTMHLQRAAWQSGWPLTQLSSATHGVQYSKVAVKLSAAMFARPENAYLVERVKIPPDWSYRFLPRLIKVLEANGVVAMHSEIAGRQNTVVPVLDAKRPLATGAPGLAHRTGAALIPVAVIREGRWSYRVRFGPPIEVDRSLPRRAAVEQATLEFGRRLSEAAAAHPSTYNGWWLLQSARPAADTDS